MKSINILLFFFISINAWAMDRQIEQEHQRFIKALRFDVRKNSALNSGLFYEMAVEQEFMHLYELVNYFEKWLSFEQNKEYRAREVLAEDIAKAYMIDTGLSPTWYSNEEKFSVLCQEKIAKSSLEVLLNKKNIMARVSVVEAHYPIYGLRYGIDVEPENEPCSDEHAAKSNIEIILSNSTCTNILKTYLPLENYIPGKMPPKSTIRGIASWCREHCLSR